MSNLQEIKDFLKSTTLPEKKQQAILDELLSKYDPEQFDRIEMAYLLAEIRDIERMRNSTIKRLAYTKELREETRKKRELQ